MATLWPRGTLPLLHPYFVFINDFSHSQFSNKFFFLVFLISFPIFQILQIFFFNSSIFTLSIFKVLKIPFLIKLVAIFFPASHFRIFFDSQNVLK